MEKYQTFVVGLVLGAVVFSVANFLDNRNSRIVSTKLEQTPSVNYLVSERKDGGLDYSVETSSGVYTPIDVFTKERRAGLLKQIENAEANQYLEEVLDSLPVEERK